MNREELIQLARAMAKASVSPSHSFSYEGKNLEADALSIKFTKELDELGKDPSSFRNNMNLIFDLLEVAISEVMPVKVLQTYGQFADVIHVGEGDKPVFKIKISEASKRRAKQFVSKVSPAGRYETFKLDGTELTIPMSAIGGAARIEYQDIVTGRISMSDYYNLMLEGIDEAIYREIAKCLEATINQIKPINKYSGSGFDEKEFDRLLQTADAYGQSTVYCTFEFAAQMMPANLQTWSDGMKDEYWHNGAFTTYKRHNVVILPQSFEDDTNARKVINPQNAWILPTGSEKPVKIAFEGTAHAKQFENRDWSTEINMYQKLGVLTYLVNPGICVYTNESLSMDNE